MSSHPPLLENLLLALNLLRRSVRTRLITDITSHADPVACREAIPVHQAGVPEDEGASGGYYLFDQYVTMQSVAGPRCRLARR